MSLKKLAVEYGRDPSYFYCLKNSNPDKYDMIFNRDKSVYKALEMYTQYIISLKHKVIDLALPMSRKELLVIMRKIGYVADNNTAFIDSLCSVIDEDNILSVRYEYILKLEKFVNIY